MGDFLVALFYGFIMSSIPSRWIVTESNIANAPDVLPALAGCKMERTKTPYYKTNTTEMASGRETRVSLWSSPRWKFTLSYEFIRDRVTQPELKKMYGFFLGARGAYGAWFYQDPYDNTVSGGIVGVGDGSTRTFQPTKPINGFSDPVYAFFGYPSVYINGVLKTYGTDYSIGSWGQITFTTAPSSGAVLTWSGSFLYVCRFANDELETVQMYKDLFSSKGVEIITLKP